MLHLPQQNKYPSSSSTVMLVGLIGELQLVRSVDVRVRGCLCESCDRSVAAISSLLPNLTLHLMHF